MDGRYTRVATILVGVLMIGGVSGVLLYQSPSTSGGYVNDDEILAPNLGSSETSPLSSDVAAAPAYGPWCRCPDLCKDEPFVNIELDTTLPFTPYIGHYATPSFGDPTLGRINTWVERQADAAHIGVTVQFVGLSNNEVYVNATAPDGRTVQVNLNNDATGCHGLLMDDPTTTNKKMGWTWMYTGRCVPEYHNITITVTVYKLGAFQFKTYACDQDTGQKISETRTYDMKVYGSGGKYHDQPYMFDHVVVGTSYGFTPGGVYHFNFTDTSRTARYEGMVRSTLTASSYFEKVWMVNDDGTLTELERSGDSSYNSYYSWNWYHCPGISSHTAHLMIQLGVEGGGPYHYSSADYYVVDEATGLCMSHINGMSHPGFQIYLQSL